MNVKLFKKGDIAVIAVIVAVALLFAFYFQSKNKKPLAVITVGGQVVETVDLSFLTEKRVIALETTPSVTVIAENGEIWFEKAECEDKLCVASGKLSKGGDTAVCLPAKTVITVIGSDVDAVVY